MSLRKLAEVCRKYAASKEYRMRVRIKCGVYDHLSDEAFLKKVYKEIMGKPLNLEHPQTFNEKLQWLKLYDRRPEYTILADKYAVKQYVAERLGSEYVLPALGVWNHFDEIDFDALPKQFVLKCTHDSGGIVICKDRKKFDVKSARKKLERSLKRDFYKIGREWPYKHVPRKIIAEPYVEDSDGNLNDYKFFCFSGVVDNVMIVTGRSGGSPDFYHFDKNWKLCQYNRLCRSLPAGYTIPKPEKMDEMFELAHRLSKDLLHVRMDFYCVDNHIYFGEYTFYNQSGFETGFDYASDLYLGSLIELPQNKIYGE